MSVPVMSDGIRSGVNWIAAERQVQRVGQRADHERLGQARHADEQAVAPREERDEQLLDHVLLADDDLGALGEICARPLRGADRRPSDRPVRVQHR